MGAPTVNIIAARILSNAARLATDLADKTSVHSAGGVTVHVVKDPGLLAGMYGQIRVSLMHRAVSDAVKGSRLDQLFRSVSNAETAALALRDEYVGRARLTATRVARGAEADHSPNRLLEVMDADKTHMASIEATSPRALARALRDIVGD